MLAKKMWLLSLIIALSLNSCVSTQGMQPPTPPPSQNLHITWIEAEDRVCLSKEDAVKLEQWLVDVEFFVRNH